MYTDWFSTVCAVKIPCSSEGFTFYAAFSSPLVPWELRWSPWTLSSFLLTHGVLWTLPNFPLSMLQPGNSLKTLKTAMLGLTSPHLFLVSQRSLFFVASCLIYGQNMFYLCVFFFFGCFKGKSKSSTLFKSNHLFVSIWSPTALINIQCFALFALPWLLYTNVSLSLNLPF